MEKLNVLKHVVNWIFPFFKDNQAIKLIKGDMKSVGGEFLTRAYDTTKGLFITDDRKPVFEQWQQAVEEGKQPDAFAEGAIKSTIESAAQNDETFKKEMEQILKDIEEKQPELVQKHNQITISGGSDIIINEDITNSTITINKGASSSKDDKKD